MKLQKLWCSRTGRSLIFTLPGHSLPSQYRSLLPVRDPEVERIMKTERASRHIRNATFALSALLVVIIVIVIALVVAFQTSVDEQPHPLLYSEAKHVVVTQIHTIRDGQAKNGALSGTANNSLQEGIPCNDHCWEYAAFKFKATCDSGVCRCHGDYYDPVTCLPNFGECHIKPHPPSATLRASQAGIQQHTYTCAINKHSSTVNEESVPTSWTLNTEMLEVPITETEILARSTAHVDTTPAEVGSKTKDDNIGFHQSGHINGELSKLSPTASTHSQNVTKENALNENEVKSETTSAHHDISVPPVPEGHTSDQGVSETERTTPKTVQKTTWSTNSIKETSSNLPEKLLAPDNRLEISKKEAGDMQRPRSSSEIHVVSVFGNRRAPWTKIEVRSQRKVNVTLVLASYNPISWEVQTGGSLEIQRVVLVSNHHVSRSRVHVARSQHSASTSDLSHTVPSSSLHTSPDTSVLSSTVPVTRKLFATGYGDDKTSGNTPHLLESISQTIGPLTTFVGVSHADLIQYDIDYD